MSQLTEKQKKTKAAEAKRKERKSLRVSKATFARLEETKRRFSAHNNARVTFSELLEECCSVADLLLSGNEAYYVDGKLYADLAEAKGAAVLAAVRTGSAVPPVTAMLTLGEVAVA